MREPPQPTARPERTDLEATRRAIRGDLHRTTTTVAVLLVVVLALALAGVFAGLHATQNLKRAEAAEADSREQLWHSYLTQAQAVRLTPAAGRRQEVLSVISNAAAIRTSLELRSEAIAALALSDLEVGVPVQPMPRATEQIEMDASLERFAFGDRNGDVFVSAVSDGQIIQTLRARELGPGTRMAVRSVAFNPAGNKLAARFAGGAMVIWDLASGEPEVSSGVEATNLMVAGMSFWPDADRISFGDADAHGQITVYDFETRQRVHTALRVGARTFRFRPGTMQVAVVADNRVEVFDYPSEEKRQTLETATRVFTLAWAPDGSELAVATEDGDITLWNVVRDTQRVLRGHSEPCVRLSFSPDGELLCSGSRDGTTRLWDVAQGQTLSVADEGLGHVFSRDGERIGFWKPASGFGAWRLSRSEGYRPLVCPKADGAFLSVDLSPEGRWCVATQSKGVRIWDVANEARESFIPVGDLHSARIDAAGTALFLCRRSGLERWTMSVEEDELRLDPAAATSIDLPDKQGARAIALSLEGERALVELSDLRLVILDLTGNSPPVFLQERTRFASLRTPAGFTGAGRFAISPNGRWAATGFGVGLQDRPQVWDANTGELAADLDAPSSVVVFSPDGQWLGTAGTSSFAVWSVGDWRLLRKFNREEPAITHGSMAFTRDSGQVAVTRTRQQAQLRDAFSDEVYANLMAPQLQSVISIRMAWDGSVLVTASATDKLQVWRLDQIRETLAPLGLDWPGQPAALSTPSAAFLNPIQTTLTLGMAGFAGATTLALLTLHRHRRAISSYLAAETRAAQRSRDLERATLELMHSQKMKALGTLAAGIAHDFNNLLSVIRMSNKLIGREAPDNEEVREHVETVEQAIQQGKTLVESMLGYSRERADDDQPKDVESVVEETVGLLSREFLSGITLTLEMERGLPRARVPAGRIEQLLLNLVVNAAEAMKGQGKLKIAAHLRAGMGEAGLVLAPRTKGAVIEITVADSGPGIHPEVRQRIFEPFFTTKTTGNRRGTGLGLSMVHSIAEQEGFGLAVESKPGQGAVFRLGIPVTEDPGTVRESHTRQDAAPG